MNLPAQERPDGPDDALLAGCDLQQVEVEEYLRLLPGKPSPTNGKGANSIDAPELLGDPGENLWESERLDYGEQAPPPTSPAPTNDSLQWEPPLPIETSPVRPPFPIDAFPAVLATYAEQAAESIQVPLDLVALDILSVLGTVLQKRVDLDTGKGAIFPLNIWTLSVYPSGGGKSRALAEVSYPLDEWENSLIDRATQQNETSQEERLEPEQRIADLLKIKSRTSDEETELRGLRGRMKDFAEVPLPDIYSTDLTQEALLMALTQNNGHHAVLSAEASDFFQIMAGRYAKEGQSSFGFFVSAYSQELIKNKRAMNGNKCILKPTLSMGLSVQPSVFDKIASNQDFVTRGLPARFLMAYPRDMRGERDIDPPAITESARRDYNAVVRSLTRIEPSRDARKQFVPYQVSLKMEARQALLAFRRWAEDSMSPGGLFCEVGKEFAARMSEHLAKVVGLLHCAAHPDLPWDICVDASTVESAARIVRWSANHVLMTFGLGGSAEMMHRAAYLHGRISAQQKWMEEGCFSVRSLQQAAKQKDRYKSGGMEALDRDLSFLEHLGYVQRLEIPRHGSRSAIYKISPFFKEKHPQHPQLLENTDEITVSTCLPIIPNGSSPHPQPPKDIPSAKFGGDEMGTLGTYWGPVGDISKPLLDKGLNAIGDVGDQNSYKSNNGPEDLTAETCALGDLF